MSASTFVVHKTSVSSYEFTFGKSGYQVGIRDMSTGIAFFAVPFTEQESSWLKEVLTSETKREECSRICDVFKGIESQQSYELYRPAMNNLFQKYISNWTDSSKR